MGDDHPLFQGTAIGADKNNPDYLYPGSGDVWDFLDAMAAWANDPNRLGTILGRVGGCEVQPLNFLAHCGSTVELLWARGGLAAGL
jgi:hypothetical protein